MDNKKQYIIVKDRRPGFSEVLNDCAFPLCVPATKGESLGSVLSKMCGKITANSLTFNNSDSIQFVVDGTNISAIATGGGGVSTNIYTANGTLLANRTVTQAGNSLTFTGGAFTLSGNVGGTPVSGPGNRLMWIPEKAAFRVGNPGGLGWWDDAEIGNYSVAMGFASHAPAEGSMAFGTSSEALGDNSMAIIGGIANQTAFDGGSGENFAGVFGTASGFRAISFGNASVASGNYSIALGQEAFATGNFSACLTPRYGSASAEYSTAVGYGASSTGSYSSAFGYQAQAIGFESIAIGGNSRAAASNSFTMGRDVYGNNYGEVVLGMWNIRRTVSNAPYNVNDRVLTVGNGTGQPDGDNPSVFLSDAFVVYKGGQNNAKIAVNPGNTTVPPNETLRVYGNQRIDNLTAQPTKLIGATAANVLGSLTLGPGISITGGQLSFSVADAGNNLYAIDGTLSGPRNVNMNGYSLQFTNAGLFRVERTSGSGDYGVYDLNQGVDYLTYNATHSTQIFSNMIGGTGISFRNLSNSAEDVTLFVDQGEIVLDNPNINGTYFRVADFNNRQDGDMLILANAITGEVAWTTPTLPSFSDSEFDI